MRVSPRRETSDAAIETHSDPNTHGRCLEVVVHYLSRSTYHIDECLLEQVYPNRLVTAVWTMEQSIKQNPMHCEFDNNVRMFCEWEISYNHLSQASIFSSRSYNSGVAPQQCLRLKLETVLRLGLLLLEALPTAFT